MILRVLTPHCLAEIYSLFKIFGYVFKKMVPPHGKTKLLKTFIINHLNKFILQKAVPKAVHRQTKTLYEYSNLRNHSGNRTYSITAKRMISGLVLKYLNGECFVIRRGYETARPVSSSFCLTVPFHDLRQRRVHAIGTRRLFQKMSERRIYNHVQHLLMTWVQSVVHIGGISRSIACIAPTIKSSRHL